MNEIKVDISFENQKCYCSGVNLITTDYNSTKMSFTFDEIKGLKVFRLVNPANELILVDEIKENEVILTGKTENDEDASLLTMAGDYIFEVINYANDGKLTSAKGMISVEETQTQISDDVVIQYLPLFDKLLGDISVAIEEANEAVTRSEQAIIDAEKALSDAFEALNEVSNLDIETRKEDGITHVIITKKDGSKTEVLINDGSKDYNELLHIPSINGIPLKGNKTLEELGTTKTDNNYTDAEKEKLAGLENYDDTMIQQELTSVGEIVDSHDKDILNISNDLDAIDENITHLETTKQDTLTAGKNVSIDENNVISAIADVDIHVEDGKLVIG